MPLNIATTRERLQNFDFKRLFIEELGWSNPPSPKPVSATISSKNAQPLTYIRTPIARLAGVVVLEITTGNGIPDAKARGAIHKHVSEQHLENLLIFEDAARSQSLWYWVKREAGKTHARDHLYVRGQPGDLFLSKLAAMVVDISELDAEGNIPVTEIANRLKTALDVERVTKKFYREFDGQRLEFVELIEGITDEHQRRWYASVLMNRLMFIYFLQKKFFLDGGNENYLEEKFAASRKRGPDQFYRVFLRPLFFEGFAKPEPARSAAARALLGKIRHLNGGLFLPHRVELVHGFPDKLRIKIPDRAFENVLSLFGRYSWNLNDTPGGKDDEINPDVLGYIFEKYINQKEFGAYYTRTEMTGYLCERTIFKLVLDRVNALCPLTPALSPAAGERGDRTQSPGKSSASSSPGAADDSPSPIGWERAGVRVQFHTISDLLLNLEAPLCRALLVEILPSLRLLDPACGSGAFLVAAMKVLIAIYAAVIGRIQFLTDAELATWHKKVQVEHPSPLYYIKKRIITENLFGVDIMEEATEIARLRLFLALVASAQTEDQLEPLPNIDFNILAGNSLIGLLRVDPKKFDAPVSSPSPPSGERAGVRGQQRMTLEHSADLGFTVESKTAPTRKETVTAFVAERNAARFAAILEDKNKSIELYRKHAFAPSPPSGERAGVRGPTDFADLVDQDERVFRLREHIEKVRAEAYQRMNQLLLDEFKALGIQFEEATWDDKKNDTGKPEKRPLQISDIEALHPFHWGYEFDKVLAAGGFDGIVTNPPWEVFKPQAKEFFDDYSDLVSKNKMTIKEFEKEQVKLLKKPEIREAWLEFRSRFPHVNLYFRNALQFRNQMAWVDGKKATTDINLYKLFLEQCANLLAKGALCGILTPGGIYTDLGAKQLREMLFSEMAITTLFGLSNERYIFEAVHHAQKFCILVFQKGSQTTEFEAAFRINPREAVDPNELDDFLHNPNAHVGIPIELVRKLAPDSLAVMEFRNSTDIVVARKSLAFPLLGEKVPNRWILDLHREFHMTDDSALYKTAGGKRRAPLYEGKMIHQFDHRFGEPRYWLDPAEARAALLPTRMKSIQRLAAESGAKSDLKPDDLRLDYQSYRLAFRDVAASTNERTMIAAILPPGVFCPHTVSLEVVFRDVVEEDRLRLNVFGLSDAERLFLVAVLNSLVADYQLRQRVTNHLSFFFIYQLPVPRLSATDVAFAPIVQRAAQLICTTPEFDALAQEVRTALRLPASAVKGVTTPAARAKLRAELDAIIAHLYGLTEEEFAYILTTFPLVSESVKLAARNAFRDAQNGLIK